MQLYAEYDHVAYDGLFDSNDMNGVAESRIDDLLTLGDIICKHNLEGIVGVTLLHRHHDLAHGERIVWRVGEDATWLATPEHYSDQALSAKNWIVCMGSGSTILRPTEFFPKTETYRKEILAAEIVMSHNGFLKEFADAAMSAGVERIFGLGLLHQRDELNIPGTTVFETSSIKNRTTKAVVIPVAESDTDIGGVTLWHFTKLKGMSGRHKCAHGNSGHCCGD